MILLPSASLQRNASTVRATALALLAMVVFVDAGAILGVQRREKNNASSRSLGIENLSGRKINMFWVNTFKKPEEFVPQFVEDGVVVGCSYGADKSISSYIGHVFEIREEPSKRTGKCVFSECRKVRVKVSDRHDQKAIVNKDFTVTMRDIKERAYSKADDMFSRCQEKVAGENVDPATSLDLITACMEDEITGRVDFDQKERTFHSNVHRSMASELIPFECADVNKTQSIAVKNVTWTDEDDDRKDHNVQILHKIPTSEIVMVDDFISKDTCNALKVYREIADEGDIVGVPSSAATEHTKQGKLLLDLFYKMYGILMDRYSSWQELDFRDDMLFQYFKDLDGFVTPSHLCTSQEEVDEVVAAMGSGIPKKCHIPGGVPEAVPTKRFVVEEGVTKEEKQERRQLAQLFFFCDEPKNKLGGLHFPFAGVHVTPQEGRAVIAVHRHEDDKNQKFDGYVNEYHMCPNHEVFVHTVYDYDPDPIDEDMDEGEL
mmetsp:Transcript_27021/g.63434  ORF Transcript_27021/g.63434 Transcript_27021/m.63434 type:complete len:489 (+) Transcript_27021:109-1575(+)|eukprot:CAMPEP_0197175898 /NCGR_PEP_ID=MMETSP1423-20130617/1989_1 /TAXON_ID=476441 /ORGANISM="Pseudo-nitzschia heimii, Strain UNC1101" /LENGTH=488 /DNA_ID=CAMNT_0042625159 /DNA_START=65 /DNA_END=1531 /DNA_ORIENTATION=+